VSAALAKNHVIAFEQEADTKHNLGSKKQTPEAMKARAKASWTKQMKGDRSEEDDEIVANATADGVLDPTSDGAGGDASDWMEDFVDCYDTAHSGELEKRAMLAEEKAKEKATKERAEKAAECNPEKRRKTMDTGKSSTSVGQSSSSIAEGGDDTRRRRRGRCAFCDGPGHTQKTCQYGEPLKKYSSYS